MYGIRDIESFDMQFLEGYRYIYLEPVPQFIPLFTERYHDDRGCYRFDFKINNNGRITKTRKHK